VPENVGRAIGAALDGCRAPQASLTSLALGPEFLEADIKIALENCRLDYLYEPDWSRLVARISRMLSRGTVVAWFQGPMAFGPRSAGTRSILCDPSNRYARENVNCFLRRTSVDDPLPVSMTKAAMEASLEQSFASPFLTMDSEVKPEWRDKLRAAVDHRRMIPVQMAIPEQSPRLCDLLEWHRERTGVPGLICTTLSGPEEPTACTPRDAIRTVFSSAIDALVIGRFLLMKDYWMLRSGTDV
jgi:carbamoyltransferase